MSDYPKNHDAERRCLSAAMRGGHSVRHEAAAGLRPEMFDRYEGVARAVLTIIDDGDRPDPDTVRGEVREAARVDEILQARCTPTNIGRYIDDVRAAYGRRKVLVISNEGAEEALAGEDPVAISERMHEALIGFSREIDAGGATPVSHLINGVLEKMEEDQGKQITGVPSGFRDLDKITKGWQPQDLIVVAGRPSMGKTSLALGCALGAALEDDPTPVGIFSLEMSEEQLTRRMLGSLARVNTHQPGRSPREWQKLARAAGKLNAAPIYIDDSIPDAVTLKGRLRRMVEEDDVGLAIVDYLQIMPPPRGKSHDRRDLEVADSARILKNTAKELNIPVLLLSQLSRKVEGRSEKRPTMSDLRDSGGIEEAADVVALLYRAEYYGIAIDENGNQTEGVAEVIIGKHRNGPVRSCELAFIEEHAAFEDLDRHQGDGTAAPMPQTAPPNDYPF